jgi:transcriptional regulator with XRE-family HTH domain
MLRRDHHFAKALRRERKLKGWSVAELARRCRVSRSTAASWEIDTEPSAPNFRRLIKLLPALSEFEAPA